MLKHTLQTLGVDSIQVTEAIRARLRQALPAEQIEAAIERGKTMGLDTVVAGLLVEE